MNFVKTEDPPVHAGAQLLLPLHLLPYYINALNMHKQLMNNEDVDFFSPTIKNITCQGHESFYP